MPPQDFLKKGAARLTAVLEKLFASLETSAADTVQNRPDASGNRSSLTKVLVSAPGLLGDFYFPSELIGGCCPRVVGKEEEIVWNAAAEACDSERVHVIWQAIENRIWYVAVRSAELASHPNTWCPFGALLPGMKDAQPAPVCYTYYSDEAATMMTVMTDGLQIHRGMSSVVRAKAERTARELGDAPIIELVPERILKLTPAPWYSVSMFEERARRILATLAVFGALSLIALSFVIWLLTAMVILGAKANLAEAERRAADKTAELLRTAEELRGSPVRDDMSAFANVNDGLLAVNGFLEVYEIKNGKTRWRAVVPPNVTADRINEMGGKTMETTSAGVAIGNAAEMEYEANSKGEKMSDDFKAIMKSMSGRFLTKAIHTFDRATMVVIGVCWGAAILMIVFALYTVSLSASTRRAAEVAAATEPILPKIDHKPMDIRDIKPLLDRLQHRYVGINFTADNGNDHTISISSTDGAKFHEWLNVVRYVDVASPKYRWVIKELCVGKCTGALMRATLIGETVTFEAPTSGDKH